MLRGRADLLNANSQDHVLIWTVWNGLSLLQETCPTGFIAAGVWLTRDILRNSGRPRRVVKQVEHIMLEILRA